MHLKFYRCKLCGQIIALVKDTKVPVVCCGEEMELLVPNVIDASIEKHVPYVTVSKNKVSVRIGELLHPHIKEHYIEWIAIETNKGMQLKKITYNDIPEVTFAISEEEKVIDVFAYCNIHGLWMKRVNE